MKLHKLDDYGVVHGFPNCVPGCHGVLQNPARSAMRKGTKHRTHEREIQPGNKKEFPDDENHEAVEQFASRCGGCPIAGGFQEKIGQPSVWDGMRSGML